MPLNAVIVVARMVLLARAFRIPRGEILAELGYIESALVWVSGKTALFLRFLNTDTAFFLSLQQVKVKEAIIG